MTTQTLAERFFEDCAMNNLRPRNEELIAWLWFTCPANLRHEVRFLIEADPRLAATAEANTRFEDMPDDPEAYRNERAEERP